MAFCIFDRKRGIHTKPLFLFIFSLYLISPVFSKQANALSLQEAENIAISRAPEIKEIMNRELALRNKAIASAQWKDPVLYVGALNVPTNSFSFKEDPMTMLKFVLQQTLPKGRTTRINYQINNEKAAALLANKSLMKIIILRELRRDWITRYYLQNIKSMYQKERKTFVHLFQVSESMFANNKTEQNALFNAKMQIAKIDEKLIDIEREYQNVEINIARWIGENRAREHYPSLMPLFPAVPNMHYLGDMVKKHPQLILDNRLVSSARATISLKEQDYKPEYSFGLSWAYRDQQELGGIYRSDFVSAQVLVSLPFFPKNRQDKRLEQSKKNYLAKTYQRNTDYKNLKERLRDAYVDYESTKRELEVYKLQIVPDAIHYAESTLVAYQNLKTEFPILADAYVGMYKQQINEEKIRLKNIFTKIELLYLQGR